jgi:hypothetical protein
MYVSIRPGKVSDKWGTHSGTQRNVGIPTSREVHHVDEGGRTYAYFVETGHAKFHPSTKTVGPGRVAARPFLRPALFQRRGD